MKFRVYERDTDRDVTDDKDWFIDIDGDLRMMTDDTSFPLHIMSNDYYYKLEIEVL